MSALTGRAKAVPTRVWAPVLLVATSTALVGLTTGWWHAACVPPVQYFLIHPTRWWGPFAKKHIDAVATTWVLAGAAYVATAYIGPVRWVPGWRPVHTNQDRLTWLGMRWWARHADHHTLVWHTSDNRAGMTAVALVAAIGAAVLTHDALYPDRPRTGTDWYATAVLTAALVKVGVLSVGKDNLTPRIRYRGKVHKDKYGVRATVDLPDGATLADVAAKRHRLASIFKVPLDRLVVTQDTTAEAGTVTFWVGAPPPEKGSGERAQVATADRCTWADGVRLGRTPFGTPVTYRTDNVHTAIVGAPYTGKTQCARVILLHAGKDPAVKIWLASGKQDAADWEALAPICEVFAGQMDNTMPDLVKTMMTQFLDHALALAAASRRQGRPKPNAVLVLEEWAAIRTHCESLRDTKFVDELDDLFTRIANTVRGAGCQVLLITQKPTDESLPTKQKAAIGQRIVFGMNDDSDSRYGLGAKTDLPFATRTGQALIRIPEKGISQVLVDQLTDEDWERGCVLAAALRGITTHPPVEAHQPSLLDPDPTDPDPPTAGAAVPPLLAAVIEALEAKDQQTASELHTSLPQDLRGKTHIVLSKTLSRDYGLRSRPARDRREFHLSDARAAVPRLVTSTVT